MRYVQAISTLKHWDAYSLEDADGFLYVCYSGENTFGAR